MAGQTLMYTIRQSQNKFVVVLSVSLWPGKARQQTCFSRMSTTTVVSYDCFIIVE